MTEKFLRRQTKKLNRFSRKKKQKWRKPRGRDNKMREKKKGKPKVVSIGYKRKDRKEYPLVKNINDLKGLDKNAKARMGRMGNKKRVELIKLAKEKKVVFVNFNENKFLKKSKRKMKKKSNVEKSVEKDKKASKEKKK